MSKPQREATQRTRAPVAARLRALRLAHQLTQRQLAERASLSPEAIWTIENGRKYPRRHTLALLARALDVSPPELIDA